MKLLLPIYTLDNKLLLPVGAELNDQIIDELIATNTYTFPTQSLLQHGTIHQDILHHISSPPYEVIFADPSQMEQIFNLVSKVQVITPILDCLDYFKTNDSYTYRHVLMVFILSIMMSKFSLEENETAPMANLFDLTHDFGKISVPLDILLKQEPLTRQERKILEQHTLAGYYLLAYYYRQKNHFPAIIAKHHHERLDGSGYPYGLRLQNRLIEIVLVCDIYDALISPRPYRRSAYDNRSALEIITELATQGKIGWEVAKALVSLNRSNKPYFEDCQISSELRGKAPADNNYGITIEDK